MKPVLAAAVFVLGLGTFSVVGVHSVSAQPPERAASIRFAAIDVYVESATPLAAWQFELTESTGSMTVVGIENGDSNAFATAPHYDLDAVAEDRADRIVVADYSLADRSELPTGRTRIATVHVRLMGNRSPEFDLQLIAAGDADGDVIPAEANFELADGRAE